MNLQLLKENIEEIDIYILDQILKGNYQQNETILDAGCGSGRNLKWFYNAGYTIYGIDKNFDDIEYCKKVYANQETHFKQASLENIPFAENSFDHVLCNAVLHFAEDLSQYLRMFQELLRILKPQGTLFIRTASIFGLEKEVEHIFKGVYNLPDGSQRFLLTKEILEDIMNTNSIQLLEDVKTTIVKDKRCMTTLVLKKE